jgi:hypothetical protein
MKIKMYDHHSYEIFNEYDISIGVINYNPITSTWDFVPDSLVDPDISSKHLHDCFIEVANAFNITV